MGLDRIFIHAWWRSGSTYVWSKLRKNDSLICYYEPLHEEISRLNIHFLEQPSNADLSRTLRHPMQSKNYYAEYTELVRTNRLKFSTALCYDRFLLQPNKTDDELSAYISGLLKGASAEKRIAVLCFCRSQMRSAWMKRVFGGVHIAQIRNPADQWASFHVANFINTMLLIALKLRNLHSAAFAHIESFERFARYMSKHKAEVVERLFDILIPEKDAFAVFLLIWMASTLQALSFGDFVLDIDRLSTDLDYQKAAARWFESIGCQIDFSDCASPSSGELPVSLSEFERMLDDTVTAIRTKAAPLVIADPDTLRKRLASLSPLSSKVLNLALAD